MRKEVLGSLFFLPVRSARAQRLPNICSANIRSHFKGNGSKKAGAFVKVGPENLFRADC